MAVKCFIFNVLFFIVVSCMKYGEQRPLDAKQYLYNYGFLNTTAVRDSTLQKALEKFQKIGGLTVTGNLTKETIDKMYSRRCGRPPNVPNFAQERKRWRSSHLTYSIKNKTGMLPEITIKKILVEVIMQWTSKVNLEIKESITNTADVEMYFTEQDGIGNVLGYAFYPENGDIFFDTDEDWTANNSLSSYKTNFRWVAAHELGHSLGLPHNYELRNSIMYPYYSETTFGPSETDIKMMQQLYGIKFDNEILCKNASVDAILNSDELIIIKDKNYWAYSNDSLYYGPLLLDELFPGLPDRIDAAFTVYSKTYFFSGNVFYKLDKRTATYRSKRISSGFTGVPNDIDAAFFDKKDTIYFFKGMQYYALSITKDPKKRVIVNGKKISVDWHGIPDSVEAAALYGDNTDNEVLFIKNGRCYKVDAISKRLLSDQPCSAFYKC